jgi:hypothetical protein
MRERTKPFDYQKLNELKEQMRTTLEEINRDLMRSPPDRRVIMEICAHCLEREPCINERWGVALCARCRAQTDDGSLFIE